MNDVAWIRGVIEGMDEEEAWGAAQAVEGWLVLRGGVPARWRDRAVPLFLVPLLPAEAEQMIEGMPVRPSAVPEEEPLLRLLARGRKVKAIARELGMSQRTVERRLAVLRDRFGVPSTADLTALLARLGFGGPVEPSRPTGG